MKTKIKLYHYSNNDIQGKIKPSLFGNNYYTNNDKKTSNIKRAFYYLDNSQIEYRFKNCKYRYITEIDKNYLYDLRQDKKKYIIK